MIKAASRWSFSSCPKSVLPFGRSIAEAIPCFPDIALCPMVASSGCYNSCRTLMRILPSSFLPFPSVPMPQNLSLAGSPSWSKRSPVANNFSFRPGARRNLGLTHLNITSKLTSSQSLLMVNDPFRPASFFALKGYVSAKRPSTLEPCPLFSIEGLRCLVCVCQCGAWTRKQTRTPMFSVAHGTLALAQGTYQSEIN
jgi:hypothetical protein